MDVAIPVPVRRDGFAIDPGGELRTDVHDQPAAQITEIFHRTRLDEETGAGAHHGRPGVLVTRVLRRADELNAPILRRAALVAKALERNPYLDFVAPRRHVAVRLVDVIGIQIDDTVEAKSGVLAAGRAGKAFAAYAILLHAQRVDGEQQRSATVVEGIEEDLDVVVGIDVVAISERGAHDRAVRLERADTEVDRIRCVERQDLRRVSRGPAIDGPILCESLEDRRAPPRLLSEVAIDLHGRIDAGQPHVGLAQAAVVDLLRVAG